jgi:hypothetical protein
MKEIKGVVSFTHPDTKDILTRSKTEREKNLSPLLEMGLLPPWGPLVE